MAGHFFNSLPRSDIPEVDGKILAYDADQQTAFQVQGRGPYDLRLLDNVHPDSTPKTKQRPDAQ